jgi:RNA polymerase sigma factor (sigma-70 family)
MNVSVEITSKGGGLSKIGLLSEFWNFRRCFLWRIRRLIRNPAAAEDIFQEACLRFLSSPAVFKHPEAGTRYFCVTLRSLTMQHFKRARRLEYREELPELICDPQAVWDRNILLDRISQAIARLPAKDRDLLDMFFEPSLTLEDKCEALQLPNSTMRYQAKRTIAKVRKMVA